MILSYIKLLFRTLKYFNVPNNRGGNIFMTELLPARYYIHVIQYFTSCNFFHIRTLKFTIEFTPKKARKLYSTKDDLTIVRQHYHLKELLTYHLY